MRTEVFINYSKGNLSYSEESERVFLLKKKKSELFFLNLKFNSAVNC